MSMTVAVKTYLPTNENSLDKWSALIELQVGKSKLHASGLPYEHEDDVIPWVLRRGVSSSWCRKRMMKLYAREWSTYPQYRT